MNLPFVVSFQSANIGRGTFTIGSAEAGLGGAGLQTMRTGLDTSECAMPCHPVTIPLVNIISIQLVNLNIQCGPYYWAALKI